jgi:DNA-binding MarR family transcriptional regulator
MSEPIPLTPARRVLRAVPAITRALAAEVRKAGAQFTLAQLSALQLLSESDLSVGELARLMHVAMPTVTQSLDSLVSKGLVTREVDTQDRRQVRLHMTPEGRRALDQALAEVERYVEELLAPLPQQRQEELAETLERVMARVTETVIERV